MGGEFPSEDVKPKTFTSFTCSQDSLPEFSSNSIDLTYSDIILSKLRPDQVTFPKRSEIILLRSEL